MKQICSVLVFQAIFYTTVLFVGASKWNTKSEAIIYKHN